MRFTPRKRRKETEIGKEEVHDTGRGSHCQPIAHQVVDGKPRPNHHPVKVQDDGGAYPLRENLSGPPHHPPEYLSDGGAHPPIMTVGQHPFQPTLLQSGWQVDVETQMVTQGNNTTKPVKENGNDKINEDGICNEVNTNEAKGIIMKVTCNVKKCEEVQMIGNSNDGKNNDKDDGKDAGNDRMMTG